MFYWLKKHVFIAETNFKKRQDSGEPPAKIIKRETDSAKENKSSVKKENPVADQNKKDKMKSETNEAISDKESKEVEAHVSQSHKFSAIDAPTPEELIKGIQALENAASADGKVREQIAQLPPDVSDPTLVPKISGNKSFFSINIFHINFQDKRWSSF